MCLETEVIDSTVTEAPSVLHESASLLGEDSLDVREEGRGTARAKVGRRVAVVKFLSGRQRHKSGEEGEDLHSDRGLRSTNKDRRLDPRLFWLVIMLWSVTSVAPKRTTRLLKMSPRPRTLKNAALTHFHVANRHTPGTHLL